MTFKNIIKDVAGAIREKRKKELNEKLAAYGLRPFERIGNFKVGEYEATGEVISVYSNSEPYFAVITLEIKKPITGEKGFYSYITSRKNAACILPLINRKYIVCTKQYRLVVDGICSNWMIEIPRGWVTETDVVALEKLYKEIPGLKQFVLKQVVDIAGRKILEDTGIRRSYVNLFLVEFETELETKDEIQRFLEGRQESEELGPAFKKVLKPAVFTLEEVNALEEEGGLDEFHSLQTWNFAKRWLRKNGIDIF